jgi:hypothetical protein
MSSALLYYGFIETAKHRRSQMSNMINFNRTDLMEGYDGKMLAYEAKGEFLKGVVAIRITKGNDKGWDIRTREENESYTVADTNIETLKKAQYTANSGFNPEYDFIRDMDAAWDFYKL